jgi:hypothetical protein
LPASVTPVSVTPWDAWASGTNTSTMNQRSFA